MSSPNHEDWDLCWYFLSGTGCRNPMCTWRHERTAGRLYQTQKWKDSGIERCTRGHRRKNPEAPFYRVKHHHDVGVEDRYGLVHYSDADNYHAKKRIELSCSPGNRLESELKLPDSSSMSVSSSGRTSAPNSSVVSMITSRDESDSEGDMSKSSMVVSSSSVGKVWRRNRRFFSTAVRRDVETPRRQLKIKWYPNKSITSILSPFAKTFVPHINLVTSANAITIGDREIMNENPQLAKMQPPENLNSGGIVFDEIDE